MLKVSACPLAISTAVELLQNPPEGTVSTLPPVKPKADEVYLYTPGKDVSKKGSYIIIYTGSDSSSVRHGKLQKCKNM